MTQEEQEHQLQERDNDLRNGLEALWQELEPPLTECEALDMMEIVLDSFTEYLMAREPMP